MKQIFELMPSCPYCEGDMAVYWEDDDNYAFIDSEGNLLVAAAGHQMSFGVPRCPMCGKRFKTGGTGFGKTENLSRNSRREER